jgi:hypothetical protein
MRHLILVTGFLVLATYASAQSATTTTTATTPTAAPPAESTVPPLTKTVAVDPNDSPMVRAAKRAVASRVPATQRRVITLNSTGTHGRFAESSGATEGPKVLPLSSDGWVTPIKPPPPTIAQQEAAKNAAAVQQKLRQLEAEQQRMAAEADEPYGGDVSEDEAEARAAALAAEREKLEQAARKPPQE